MLDKQEMGGIIERLVSIFEGLCPHSISRPHCTELGCLRHELILIIRAHGR